MSIKRKQSSVASWIAAEGGREQARLTLTYFSREVYRLPVGLLLQLLEEFDLELPHYACARERAERLP